MFFFLFSQNGLAVSSKIGTLTFNVQIINKKHLAIKKITFVNLQSKVIFVSTMANLTYTTLLPTFEVLSSHKKVNIF